MALYTTVMEEITAYTGLSPAAFFTIVVLMVALHRTLCGLFVAMGRNINNLILNRNNSSNTTAQPLHQLEEVTDHQLTLPGSSERNTSSMAFQGASSCSTSSTNQWTHDVFLSFRGEDTRYNFTAHLYQAFHRKGIITFMDDKIRRGEEISPALVEAIKKSRISIIVFSQTYASSRWCLDEVLEILKCKKSKGQTVLPVFYKVDPSDVRKQKNSFKEAFDKHKEEFKDDLKVQSWKAALEEVANLTGYPFALLYSAFHTEKNENPSPSSSPNEAELIDKIVQEVLRIVKPTCLPGAKHPVGIESRKKEINSLLRIDKMNDIRMVGILGVGGIGKTAIAIDIYNSIYSQFDGCCFLESVREASKQHFGIVTLQRTLLSTILGDAMKVEGVGQGTGVIKRSLCSKRVLLILDDVDKKEQLDQLAGGADWFGPGSRIIITTRDMKVLINHKVDADLIYRVKELDREEALELFRWNAFKGAEPTGGLPTTRDMKVLIDHKVDDDLIYWVKELGWDEALKLFHWNAFKGAEPTDDFWKLMECAISYAGGLPLALEVLGSDMYGRDIHQWKSALQKYKKIPHGSIQEILRISYDGLHATEQDIFLDIACFFKGMREDYVKTMLESCGFFPDHGIKVLTEKSLITIDRQNILGMHDLLQDMGREIVREESPQDPGKRSRLWFDEDVCKVLKENTGTNAIQGILIDLPKGEMMQLSPKAFKKMKSLRLLIVNSDVRFSQEPIFLPNELRVLDWPNCPLEFLPSNFHGRNLVTLTMPRSCLKGLEGVQKFQSMKILDFSQCQSLKKIPDVYIPNLEKLTLDGCLDLVEIHDSIGSLDKLVLLSLKNCKNLSSFPARLKLRSLRLLKLDGCSRINHFPEIECEMKYLESIECRSIGIKELPLSIRYLTGLKRLDLIGCRNLTNLPSSIYELQHLEDLFLRLCPNLVTFPEKMGNSGQSMLPPTNSSVSNDDCSSTVFPALRRLNLRGCVLTESNFFRIFNCSSTLKELYLSESDIVTIPACIKRFVALKRLEVDNCKQLREIQESPPIPEFPKEHPLRHLGFNIKVTGNKIPDWFSYRKEVSNSNSCKIDIDVPAGLDGEITAIAFCAVLETEYDTFPSLIRVYVFRPGVHIYFSSSRVNKDCAWLHIHVPESFKRKEYIGHLIVRFDWSDDVILTAVKSCGVHLVRGRKDDRLFNRWFSKQVSKRPRDDDGNLESNWYPQQKRHSSSLGVRISDAEAEAKEF